MIGNQIIILLIFLIFTFVNSMEIRKTMLPVLRPVGGDEEVNAIRESIESGWWGKGPKVAEFEKKFADRAIPRPPFWTGYRVIPHEIEFWEEGDFRLHNRILYSLEASGWSKSLLYP